MEANSEISLLEIGKLQGLKLLSLEGHDDSIKVIVGVAMKSFKEEASNRCLAVTNIQKHKIDVIH